MTLAFVQNATVRDLYDLDPEKTFEQQFSRTSLESILFYVAAKSIQTLERIFDTHRREVNEIIDNILPHRAKWYRDKALKFMLGEELIPDTDGYDTTGMTDQEIESKRIVKYATAVEEPGSSVLIIKIATGEPGNLSPIGGELIDGVWTGQAAQFQAYINEIRDAGVRWNLINQQGDKFQCSLDVFYSPLQDRRDVELRVYAAVRGYITGLPFNGEYSNMALIDAVQQVEGVLIAEISRPLANDTPINIKTIPKAGYFKFDENNITLELKAHSAVQ